MTTATCNGCGRPATFVRSHRTPSGKPVLKYRCDNPACAYPYINFNGKPAQGQPVWMEIPR